MKVTVRQLFFPALMATSVFVIQGCLATRDWVQERLDPVAGRVSQSEQRLNQAEGQIGGLGGRMTGAMFLVAGHTDNVGSEDYNYELGKKRADAVSRYLITQKKMDPLRVVTVSYLENAPMVENSSAQGRGKNRRVEILLYRDGITSAAAASSATPAAEPQAAQPPQQPAGERFSQR